MTYSTRSADLAVDRATILRMWSGALEGTSSRAQKYRLHYLEYPWGTPTVELLEHDGVPIGVATVQPRPMLHGKERIAAGLLMDFAVAPAHRSVGPALRLQRALLARCEQTYDLVYGLPNANARALSERAGMTRIGEMTRFVKVLRYGRYVAPYLPASLASRGARALDVATTVLTRARLPWLGRKVAAWTEAPIAEIDELWVRTAHLPWLLASRDLARLRWQLQSRDPDSVRLMLVRGRAGGHLEGWFACERTADSIKIVDYWTVNAGASPSRELLDTLARAAMSAGCASISVELVAPDVVLNAWTEAGFTRRDSRPVFAKCSNSSTLDLFRRSLFMTGADEDE